MTVDKAALKGVGGPSDPTVPYSKDDLARAEVLCAIATVLRCAATFGK